MKLKILGTLAVLTSLFLLQIATMSLASAAGNNQINIGADFLYGDGTANISICNNGSTSIKAATLSFSTVNYDIEKVKTFNIDPPGMVLPTDPGTFDENTGTWTGLVDPTQCVGLMAFGQSTTTSGNQIEVTVNLLTTTEVDDTVENYAGNSATATRTYTTPGDLASDAHLLTTGAVNPGDTISYQVDITNNGPGTIQLNGFLLYVLALPDGSTFNNAEDLNTNDHVVVDPNQCFVAGQLDALDIPGLEAYGDRTLVFCMLSTPDDMLPAGSTDYSFKVNLTAGASLAAGDADVIGIAESNERGTADIVKAALSGTNVFTLGINNISFLQYDPGALQATVNRCPGQGETTSDGTGCFRISFNKKIVASSFTTDDIAINGSKTASVSSLTQLDTYTWEVRIVGISPNETLELQLDLNSIQDYSAIQNATQVLGINTIRYVAGSANGSLPSTGVDSIEWMTALVLITFGFALARTSKRYTNV